MAELADAYGSDIESAKKIFTAHGKTLTPYESGGYLTEQAMVLLILDDENQLFLDPSFKYYTKKADATDLDSIMATLDTQYNLSDSTLDLYAVSNKIESDYKSGDLLTTFQQYEIVQQDINNTLSYLRAVESEIRGIKGIGEKRIEEIMLISLETPWYCVIIKFDDDSVWSYLMTI